MLTKRLLGMQHLGSFDCTCYYIFQEDLEQPVSEEPRLSCTVPYNSTMRCNEGDVRRGRRVQKQKPTIMIHL